jgi:general secretion pathway protein G
MKECCETGVRKKRYGHWVVLGIVVVVAAALQLIPDRIRDGYGVAVSVKSKVDIVSIVAALEEYATNNKGAYPTSLQPLVTPDVNGHAYLEGYNGKLPRDPWKREYLYETPTPAHLKPHVWSFGADGKRGGSGDDADIDSDKLREERE